MSPVGIQTDLLGELGEYRRPDVSGTFLDNMKLPVHRWFRYSAGYSGQWVATLIRDHWENTGTRPLVFDPFAGSGTTCISADIVGVESVGVESHPFVSRLAQAKANWNVAPGSLREHGDDLVEAARSISPEMPRNVPPLLGKCYDPETLLDLFRIRSAWESLSAHESLRSLTWLALTASLRGCSTAGTAQWQYILPNKRKVRVRKAFSSFEQMVGLIASDIGTMQSLGKAPLSNIVRHDIRHPFDIGTRGADLVVTSPPYANNYDYADATRLEMTFWGEVDGWGDLHRVVRRHLMCSSSQHASKEKWNLDDLLESPLLEPIASELALVCRELATVRQSRGGKKHYHTMIAGYFRDMALAWRNIRRICSENCTVVFVVGDSAPYGVYVPVEEWLGKLAIAAGFSDYRFEKMRDRNTKWKNRKHRVPLHEGRLWIS